MLCCRPKKVPGMDGRRRAIRMGDLYCRAFARGKKIGTIVDWTWLPPKWCLRLDPEEVKE